jgi:hypothetical protein
MARRTRRRGGNAEEMLEKKREAIKIEAEKAKGSTEDPQPLVPDVTPPSQSEDPKGGRRRASRKTRKSKKQGGRRRKYSRRH